jgi:hypothetical protein
MQSAYEAVPLPAPLCLASQTPRPLTGRPPMCTMLATTHKGRNRDRIQDTSRPFSCRRRWVGHVQHGAGIAKNAGPRTKCSANGKTGVLEALRIDVAAFVVHQPPLVMGHAPHHL